MVVRRTRGEEQLRLQPAYAFILVSRNDLLLQEQVRRHRAKHGQENTIKGRLRGRNLHHLPSKPFVANRA